MKELQGLLNGFLGTLQGGSGEGGGQDRSASSAGAQGGDFLAGTPFEGKFGQLAGAAGVGGLAGLLAGSKGGRKFVGKAATYGGLALLGGLAYRAYTNWQAGKAPASTAASTAAKPIPMPPDGPAERGYLSFLAGRLALDPKLVEHLHASVEGAADPAG